jgi:hypothetical protein
VDSTFPLISSFEDDYPLPFEEGFDDPAFQKRFAL